MVWISKRREFKSFGEKEKETRAHKMNATGRGNKREGGTKERSEKSAVIVSFVEPQKGLQHSSEGMGRLNGVDIRSERIRVLWSTVRESVGQRF